MQNLSSRLGAVAAAVLVVFCCKEVSSRNLLQSVPYRSLLSVHQQRVLQFLGRDVAQELELLTFDRPQPTIRDIINRRKFTIPGHLLGAEPQSPLEDVIVGAVSVNDSSNSANRLPISFNNGIVDKQHNPGISTEYEVASKEDRATDVTPIAQFLQKNRHLKERI